jgi:transcriptional regulator with XRE-family HTH domain
MGARLRAIRQSLGYKQSDVAAMMGRKSAGAVTIISRLELGKVPYPSLGLIADYLRACDSSFHAIGDVLGAYIKADPRKVKTADTAGRVTGTRPAARKGQSADSSRRARAEERLFELLTDKDAPRSLEEREALARFGSSVFRALVRGRTRVRGERAGTRVKKLPDPAAFARVERAMAELADAMERAGEFDRSAEGPTPAKPARRADKRLREDYRSKDAWRNANRAFLIERVQAEVKELLRQAPDLKADRRLYWAQVPSIWMIAEETDGKTAEREKRLDKFLAPQSDKATLRVMAELVFGRYEELKKLMLPDPADWPGAVDPGPKGW